MVLREDGDRMRVVIVDDELHGRENLRMILEAYCREVLVVGLAGSVVEALEMVKAVKPEVVFLDINMPVLDGFDFLEGIGERGFRVVFVSAHEEYGIRAVKAGASDYLLKPVNIRELKLAVKKLLDERERLASAELRQESGKLLIPAAHGFRVLLIDDIIRLEADGCYTRIILQGGESELVSRTLKEFDERLPGALFFRVHKSHLIGLKHIRDYSSLSGSYVTMTDGSRVEISRRRAPEFVQKIKSVLKSL